MQKFLDKVEWFLSYKAVRRRAEQLLGRAVGGLMLALAVLMVLSVLSPVQQGAPPQRIQGYYLPSANAQPFPPVPTNFAIATSFITPAGSGIQKYVITPTGPIFSGISEVYCTLVGAALGATDLVLPPFMSATTPNAGSPPNYIVLQISSTVAGTWRCIITQHPY